MTAPTSKLSELVEGVKKGMRRLAIAGLFSLWIGGKPVPAGRPRVTRWGTYYPKTYTDWQKASWQSVAGLDQIVSNKPIALLVEVNCPRPKKTDHVAPMGDVDNFAKGPMDLITKHGTIWKDDRQVVFLTTVKRWVDDPAEVGFRLWWCEVETE